MVNAMAMINSLSMVMYFILEITTLILAKHFHLLGRGLYVMVQN